MTFDLHRLLLSLSFGLLLLTPACRSLSGPGDEPEHPFLITTRDQFPALRERAEREPWATMKKNALERVARGAPTFAKDQSHLHAGKVNRLHMYFGACALAYILQPDRRRSHANRVHRGITDGLDRVVFDESHKHNGVVNPMGAAFSAIIALDVVYDHLTEQQINEAESVIDRKLSNIEVVGAWPLGRRGTHGTWQAYRGLRTFPDGYYHHHYTDQMTEDGVTTEATNYAWSRLASSDSRPQKTGYADVLEFTGADNRYYDNERLEKFYRWLYGHAVTPARHLHAFGDFIFHSKGEHLPNSTLSYRVGRFDRTAARYAAWALKDREPPGHVLSFVLKEKTYEPKVPSSKLYPDGGAFFREPQDTPEALGAALYNITGGAGWHMNRETNSISFSAHETRLLVNGGWLGPSTRPASLQNTVSIEGKDHETRSGNGLRDGLTGPGLDYASGHSGGALPGKALFKRSLVLVHGDGTIPGYLLTVDEVQAPSGARVDHYLQPATDSEPEAIRKNGRYDVDVNLFNPPNDTRFAIYYGSSPSRVRRDTAPTGSNRRPTPDHHRLTSMYRTDDRGRARLITVLFPYTDRIEPPSFETIAEDDLNGTRISHGENTTDVLYSTVGKSLRTRDGNVRFRGKLALFRRRNQTTSFYLLRRGRQFRRNEIGFDAEHTMSLYMNGTRGRISTLMKTSVTFYHPGLQSVKYEGRSLRIRERSSNSVTVDVPEGGNKSIRLVTGE